MGYSLAKENSDFVKRMLKLGRFNNQSEVIREALRRMEREEKSYLNPPALSDADAMRIYARDPEADSVETKIGRKSKESIRNTIKRRKLELDDL